MAATQGNRWWELRTKHGRDKIFATPEIMWEAACEYFEYCEDNPLMKIEQAKKGPGQERDLTEDELIALQEAKDFGEPEPKIDKYTGFVELPTMRPFTLTGLCLYLGVNTHYFNDFEANLKKGSEKALKLTDEEREGFSDVIKRIRETIYTQKFEGAASGFLNSNIIARDLGLVDKKQVDAKVEQPLFDLGGKGKTEN